MYVAGRAIVLDEYVVCECIVQSLDKMSAFEVIAFVHDEIKQVHIWL